MKPKKKEIPVGAAVNPLPALSSPRTGPHTAKVVQEDAHPAVGLMSAPASSTCVCVCSIPAAKSVEWISSANEAPEDAG